MSQTDYLAGFRFRFAAYLIDIIVQVILNLLTAWLLGFAGHLYGSGNMTVMLVQLLVGFLYFVVPTYLLQQTLGKKVVGIKVVKEDGSKPDLAIVIFREVFGRILSGIVFCLGYLMCLLDSEMRTWHDRLFKTRVVYVNPPLKKESFENRRKPRKILFISILVSAPFLFFAVGIGGYFVYGNKVQNYINEGVKQEARAKSLGIKEGKELSVEQCVEQSFKKYGQLPPGNNPSLSDVIVYAIQGSGYLEGCLIGKNSEDQYCLKYKGSQDTMELLGKVGEACQVRSEIHVKVCERIMQKAVQFCNGGLK